MSGREYDSYPTIDHRVTFSRLDRLTDTPTRIAADLLYMSVIHLYGEVGDIT